MSTPLWVSEAAERFWAMAGGAEPFPRALERAVFTLPTLDLVRRPRLTVARVHAWLREQGLDGLPPTADRPLRACLFARHGLGIIFLDRADPADEQRFSLAHELAHFLHDYWHPRETARVRLGEAVLAVLDGERSPTVDERVDALLARVPLGPHLHLMERTEDGHIAHTTISAAERAADRLAYELLAPAVVVLAQVAHLPPAERGATLAALLTTAYGLPALPARQYAALLAPPPRPADSLLDRLGLTRCVSSFLTERGTTAREGVGHGRLGFHWARAVVRGRA